MSREQKPLTGEGAKFHEHHRLNLIDFFFCPKLNTLPKMLGIYNCGREKQKYVCFFVVFFFALQKKETQHKQTAIKKKKNNKNIKKEKSEREKEGFS